MIMMVMIMIMTCNLGYDRIHIKRIAHKWGHLLFSDRYMESMLQGVRKRITFRHHK